jgi:hypothetical protein
MAEQKRKWPTFGIDMPERVFRKHHDNGYVFVPCPICGCDYTHLLPHFPQADCHLICGFWCEQGHRFGIQIEAHKGLSLVTLERLPDVPAEGTRTEFDPLQIQIYNRHLEADNQRLRDELAKLTERLNDPKVNR